MGNQRWKPPSNKTGTGMDADDTSSSYQHSQFQISNKPWGAISGMHPTWPQTWRSSKASALRYRS